LLIVLVNAIFGSSATTGVGEAGGGKGHNGGVWEWTSTVFDKYDGFVPSTLYPGYESLFSTVKQSYRCSFFLNSYSQDFFDDTHQVVVRIASNLYRHPSSPIHADWWVVRYDSAYCREAIGAELVSAGLSLPLGWGQSRL
jgi:formylglycine-generating enzyme required for sulfatase activity